MPRKDVVAPSAERDRVAAPPAAEAGRRAPDASSSGALELPGLALAGVRHAATTRALGDLKGAAGLERLARVLGCAPAAIVRGRQVHGVEAALVARGGPAVVGDVERGADVLATGARGVFLLTLSADCAPVALVDVEAGAVAVAHAGWRGAVAGVASRAVRFLEERLGARASRLRVAVGPRIGACCLEVGPEVVEAARPRPGGGAAMSLGVRGRPHLDLGALIAADLVEAGVPADAIEASPLCTHCRADLFFSYRRAKDAERFGLAIGLV
jgi:hypothetical protein